MKWLATLSVWIIVCCAGCGGDEKAPVNPKPSVSDENPNGNYNVSMTVNSNSCGSHYFEPAGSFTTAITVSGSSINFRGATGTYLAGHAVITAVSGCVEWPGGYGGYLACHEMIYDLVFLRFQGSGDYIGFEGTARWRHSEQWHHPYDAGNSFSCETTYYLIGTKKTD
jgi:hypothetical protein